MAEKTLTQCRMTHGAQSVTGWIPSEAAKVGKKLCLKDGPGDPEDVWEVTETWQTRPEAERIAASRLYLKHRKGTDAHRDSDGWDGPDR